MSVGVAELPGSANNYDVAEKTWEPRPKDEDPHVPLLGTAGRMGLVLGRCRWPDAAFRLLFWLSDEQSLHVCPESPATTLFRSTHVESPQAWVEEEMPAPAVAWYAEMTQQTLCRPHWMYGLRLPGRRKYLAALDEAVHRAVRGEQTAEASLREAAEAWRRITDELGRERQREAYWKSLGLE
jgi:multiple sugar transport system substrate-binding protein